MSESDLATVVVWDPADGVGAVRTDTAGHDVWMSWSAAQGGLDATSLVEGARVAVTYESTPDQDGYRWIASAISWVGAADAVGEAIHATTDDASFSTLTIGRRPWLSAAVALVALTLSTHALWGGFLTVMFSRYTAVSSADGASFLEWAPPFTVWQLTALGVMEFSLIGAAAAAWWGAWSLWSGRGLPELAFPSPLPFVLGAGVAMIAATALALITHVSNWNEWHALIAQHPEWNESPDNSQVPVAVVVAALLVAAVVAAYVSVRRRLRPHGVVDSPQPGLSPETKGGR